MTQHPLTSWDGAPARPATVCVVLAISLLFTILLASTIEMMIARPMMLSGPLRFTRSVSYSMGVSKKAPKSVGMSLIWPLSGSAYGFTTPTFTSYKGKKISPAEVVPSVTSSVAVAVTQGFGRTPYSYTSSLMALSTKSLPQLARSVDNFAASLGR